LQPDILHQEWLICSEIVNWLIGKGIKMDLSENPGILKPETD
jgi:hypothetical protein